ncbi:MAG: ABC transporter permease subunit [Akkermansia sp.]|nr:ABC transporter permease subunit [Akkermansia sp.]
MKKHHLTIATILVFLFMVLLPGSACGNTGAEPPAPAPAAKGSSTAPRKKISCIQDLKGYKLAVPQATVQDVYIQQHYPELTVVRYNFEADMVQALQQELCDAIIMDDVICYALTKKFDNITILGDSPVPVNDMGMVFGKEQAELCQQFNTFLKELRASGEYDKLMERWLKHFDTAPMPEIEEYTEGEPLVVGMEPCTEPIVFVRDGEVVGFDAELVKRFAAWLKRPLIIEKIDYYGLITAAAAGRVHMAASGMLITDERSESVLFSDSYYESHSRIAVLTRNATTAQEEAAAPASKEEKRGFFASVVNSFYRNIIQEQRYLLLWDGFKLTVIISVCAVLLGTLLGAGVCYLRMSSNAICRRFAIVYIDIMRGTPVLVLLMLMFYVVFAQWNTPATIVAIITFGMNFAAYVSEMFRTSICSVDRGQTEAGIAMGFSPVRTFIYIVLPQAVQRVLPVYKGELISLIKNTSIVGYIAIEDLTKVSDIIRGRTFDPFFPLIMVAVLYFLIAWLFTLLLDRIGRKFNA